MRCSRRWRSRRRTSCSCSRRPRCTRFPVTILSRCQRFDFKLISTARLAEHLDGILRAEKIDADAGRGAPDRAAGRRVGARRRCRCSTRRSPTSAPETLTAEVTADVLGVADRRLLVELAGAALDRDAGTALRLIARAADRGVDFGELGRSFLGFLRDLEVIARVSGAKGADVADLVDATPEEIEEARALAGRAAPGSVPGAVRSLGARRRRGVAPADAAPAVRDGGAGSVRGGADGAARRSAAAPRRARGAAARRRRAAPARPGAGRATGAGRRPGSRPKAPRGTAELGGAPPPAPRRSRRPPRRRRAAPSPPPRAAAPAAAGPASRSPRPGGGCLAAFEAKGPRLAALLAHAEVVSLSVGRGDAGLREQARRRPRREGARGDRARRVGDAGPAD